MYLPRCGDKLPDRSDLRKQVFIEAHHSEGESIIMARQDGSGRARKPVTWCSQAVTQREMGIGAPSPSFPSSIQSKTFIHGTLLLRGWVFSLL